MSDWKIFFNPRCSKCREALCLLEDERPEVVPYLDKPPTERELLRLMEILDGQPRDLVRVKEEGFVKNPFSLADKAVIARELAKRPELLERPIVVRGSRALVCRPAERVKELFIAGDGRGK